MDKFKVGFAKVNITPDFPVPLGGYGSEKTRIHDRVLNEIYFTAIAITDPFDTTLIVASFDMVHCRNEFYEKIVAAVEKELGIPREYFHLSGTHTHSSVAAPTDENGLQAYFDDVIKKGIKACRLALSDRKPAQMYVGETKTERLNFIRHYYREDGTVTSDNYYTGSKAPIVKHITEPDETVRVIKFVRENEDGSEARDVLLINWQVHNHLTGGAKTRDLAADCVGAICKAIESRHNVHAAYFQGCAGNLNEVSRIKSENRTYNYIEYGMFFADYIDKIYDNENLTPMPAGKIKCIREKLTININRAEEDRLEDAKKVMAYRSKYGVNDECKELAKEMGFHSPYHATAIFNRSYIEEQTYDVFVNAYRIGEIGWVTAPFEVYDQTGVDTRLQSPFKFTFTQGYTDGANSYMPTRAAFQYGCYEADITKNAEDSAEKLCNKWVEMLNSLK